MEDGSPTISRLSTILVVPQDFFHRLGRLENHSRNAMGSSSVLAVVWLGKHWVCRFMPDQVLVAPNKDIKYA